MREAFWKHCNRNQCLFPDEYRKHLGQLSVWQLPRKVLFAFKPRAQRGHRSPGATTFVLLDPGETTLQFAYDRARHALPALLAAGPNHIARTLISSSREQQSAPVHAVPGA